MVTSFRIVGSRPLFAVFEHCVFGNDLSCRLLYHYMLSVKARIKTQGFSATRAEIEMQCLVKWAARRQIAPK
ncbi:hypothetical protein J2T09_004254 [Neorhizobium huautlense]|uniref:Transposase n=1 Tax=Neorhizobium huautlense TaxID=67774 RepID=A0ABT9PZG6_9HYPH|nr:hypothetical protein [Neorhizobium huautlense]MDP9839478.1 hypothetical protein [Neorhizobium huautlense]